MLLLSFVLLFGRTRPLRHERASERPLLFSRMRKVVGVGKGGKKSDSSFRRNSDLLVSGVSD